MTSSAVPLARGTLRELVARHPLATFLLLAFAASWIVAPLDASSDLGSINGFHILFGALPAFSASLISAFLGPTPSGIPARRRWRLWGILSLLLLAFLALQRVWSAAGLITVRGMEPQPAAYPNLAALLTDLLASAAIAWLLSGVRSSRQGVRDLLRTLDPRRQPLPLSWCLLALALYPLVVLLGNGISTVIGLPVPSQPTAGPWLWLVVDALLALLGVIIGGGGLEEPGWRGFALPLLDRRWGPLLSSLVLGVIWTLWHGPLFWFGIFKGGASSLPLFTLVTIPLAILLTTVFSRSGGSLPAVILLHASYNTTSMYLPVSNLASELWLFLALVVAAWMWRWPRQFSLDPASGGERLAAHTLQERDA